jgi:6-phosphogluconolactonase
VVGIRGRRWVLAVGMVVAQAGFTGCGQFFPPTSSTGSGSGSGGSGSGSGSGLDSVYVANSNPSLESIAAFSLSTASGTAGALTALGVSPASVGAVPSLLAINKAGSLLYEETSTGSIYVYVVNSNGSLTLGNSNGVVATVFANAMTVDPSGNWLLVGSTPLTGGSSTVQVYQINQTNGVLTATGSPLALDNGTLAKITFAPNGTNAFAALGTGGVDALTFNSSTGVLGKLSVLLQPLGSSYADNGLAVDPLSKYLFVTETGTNGVRVLAINTNGTLTEVSGSPYLTDLGAGSVIVDKTGAYVYVANSGANSISGFALSSAGVLTPLAGSPYTTGSAPESLAEDSSSGYLLAACAGGNPDLQVFSITPTTGTNPGALVTASTASTGTVSPAVATVVVTTP